MCAYRGGEPEHCGEPFHDALSWNVKGAMGEALVRKYFEYAGWTVLRTGVEAVGSHLLQHAKLDAGELRALPDMLVMKPAGSMHNPPSHELGQAFYVEVKTWREWRPERLQDYAKFSRVLLVWVGPDGMRGAWMGDGSAHGWRPKEGDFAPLHRVGTVWVRHCEDGRCEARLRASFDTMARSISLAEGAHDRA